MLRLGHTSCARALTLLFAIALVAAPVRAQSSAPVEEKRPIKHLVQPSHDRFGEETQSDGHGRIEVTIGPDGRVKRTRVPGGHPVQAAEAEQAAQKTMFEPGPRETVETMKFKF
jgi:hypothetical protein